MATAAGAAVFLMRENAAPALRLSFSSLMDICLIIRGGIGHLQETGEPDQAHQQRLQTLIHLHARLMSIPHCVTGIAILLSQEEITELDAVVVSFGAYIRDHVPPSAPRREETLQALDRMHEALAHLLS